VASWPQRVKWKKKPGGCKVTTGGLLTRKCCWRNIEPEKNEEAFPPQEGHYLKRGGDLSYPTPQKREVGKRVVWGNSSK